jgi:hypothetical protein
MTNVIADQALAEGKIAQIDSALFDDPNYQLMDINFAEKNIGATRILYDLATNQDKMKL